MLGKGDSTTFSVLEALAPGPLLMVMVVPYCRSMNNSQLGHEISHWVKKNTVSLGGYGRRLLQIQG